MIQIFYNFLYQLNTERLGKADIGTCILELYHGEKAAAHSDDINIWKLRF
jgi:hypothetical protein